MIRTLLGLAAPPETDHEADALALAVTHLHHAGRRARSAALAGALPARAARGSVRRRR
jgi:Holliday junction resolvasome RuvABC endonuclease subunit